ncbi:MAG: [4Fe-4S] proteins maturation [Alyxoria varia]|nr:MAG: [4Fe-4S] proteins maturation [Alyxoria varia]
MERTIRPAYLHQFSRNLTTRGTLAKDRVFNTPPRQFASAASTNARSSAPVAHTSRKILRSSQQSVRSISDATSPRRHVQIVPQRLFSASTPAREAGVPMKISNPRKDEDGKDMLVGLTQRAANRLRQIIQTDHNPDLALRVTVESGGCHGFQYLMSLTDTSKISDTDDTVFEATPGDDKPNTAPEAAKAVEAAAGPADGSARVVLDEPSLELLKGSKVDYTMELIGSQFKIVDNPAASSSCGCGTSFDIKG